MIEEVRTELEKLIREVVKPAMFQAEVVSVDTNKKTCTVKEFGNDTEYTNVQLQPLTEASDNGIWAEPKENSVVIVARLDNSDKRMYIVGYTLTEAIRLNGKENGGLVNWPDQKKQLDKNSQLLNTILTVLKTPIPEAGLGAPSAFQAALLSATAGQTPGNYENLENEKVTH